MSTRNLSQDRGLPLLPLSLSPSPPPSPCNLCRLVRHSDSDSPFPINGILDFLHSRPSRSASTQVSLPLARSVWSAALAFHLNGEWTCEGPVTTPVAVALLHSAAVVDGGGEPREKRERETMDETRLKMDTQTTIAAAAAAAASTCRV